MLPIHLKSELLIIGIILIQKKKLLSLIKLQYLLSFGLQFLGSITYGDRNLICSCNVNQGETLEEKKCA